MFTDGHLRHGWLARVVYQQRIGWPGGGSVLCTREDESHNHLFFECGFSFRIWDWMIWKCGPQGSPREFTEALEWVSRWRKGKSSQSLVLKLSFSATVYHIWRERNCRIFQPKKMDGGRIIQSIVSRACIMGWREAPTTAENRISREDWALHRGFLASWYCCGILPLLIFFVVFLVLDSIISRIA